MGWWLSALIPNLAGNSGINENSSFASVRDVPLLLTGREVGHGPFLREAWSSSGRYDIVHMQEEHSFSTVARVNTEEYLAENVGHPPRNPERAGRNG